MHTEPRPDVQTCPVCETTAAPSARAEVTSNVRRFRAQTFSVWRCASCASIHAAGDVDLDEYYASYPLHEPISPLLSRPMYGKLLRRLKRAGLNKGSTLLDYGCGNGALAHFVDGQRGFRCAGYDAYSETFNDDSVLGEAYDALILQDVIEHVASPRALLDECDRLLRSGGLISLGTPDASRLDLADPRRHRHSLHQPYHRHILSKRALLSLTDKLGWQPVASYETMYANTVWPFINSPSIAWLMRSRDDTLDAALSPPSAKWWLALPYSLFLGFFGGLFATRTEMTVIFRKT